MSYFSLFNPLLRELGQGGAFLHRSLPIWGADTFFHGSLHDLWGRRTFRGFGDTDVHETKEKITITTDLPGVKKEDIHVKCVGDVLTVFGSRDESNRIEDDIYGNMERAFGSISKSVRLPPGVQLSEIAAKYKDGVLAIEIPKPKQSSKMLLEVNIPVEYLV